MKAEIKLGCDWGCKQEGLCSNKGNSTSNHSSSTLFYFQESVPLIFLSSYINSKYSKYFWAADLEIAFK